MTPNAHPPHAIPVEFSGGPWDGQQIDLPELEGGELPEAIELREGDGRPCGCYVRARRVTPSGKIVYAFEPKA